MTKYIVNTNNVATNLVVVNDLSVWQPPENSTLELFDETNPVEIGWIKQDGTWINPYAEPQ